MNGARMASARQHGGPARPAPRTAPGRPGRAAWQSYPVTSAQPADPAANRRRRTCASCICRGPYSAPWPTVTWPPQTRSAPCRCRRTSPARTGPGRGGCGVSKSSRTRPARPGSPGSSGMSSSRWPSAGPGYHGPPDRSGMVEIGYAVDPAYRGAAMPGPRWRPCWPARGPRAAGADGAGEHQPRQHRLFAIWPRSMALPKSASSGMKKTAWRSSTRWTPSRYRSSRSS